MRPLVLTVYGTRPEAIKVAPVVRALQESRQLRSMTAVTGQHREMLQEVNQIFGIDPGHDLDIMRHGQTLAQITSRVLDGLDPILESVRPDAVMVQGDTTTSTAAALAAFYRQIPVVHLEAGLRSHNISSPFPEEANRRITSQIAAPHLAPTAVSKANLVREGVSQADIAVTGNTVIDALLATLDDEIRFKDPVLDELTRSPRRVLLVTIHHRENWGEAVRRVGRAVARIAAIEPDLMVVLPAHRNPVVREAMLSLLCTLPNVVITEPLPYGEFTRLLKMAHLVLTDSGGVQEEAPSLGKPVLVMRDNTERPEAVAAGTVKLVGTDEERIVAEVRAPLHDDSLYRRMANAVNPYGDGRASERTCAAILHYLKLGERVSDFVAATA